MSATYSINVGTIYEASKLDSISSVLITLPDNVNKLITPKAVRSAIYTTWENIAFKPTSVSSSTIEYIGIDQSTFKEKIFFGKKQLGSASIMNDTLLNSDVDIFIYNTKSDADLTSQDTKIAILSGTDSSKYSYAPYLSALRVVGATNSKIDFTIRNPDLNGGDINIISDYGYININGLKFPSITYNSASASNGKTLVYRGGTMSWESGGVGGGGGDTTGLSSSIISISNSVYTLSLTVSNNISRIESLSSSVTLLSSSVSAIGLSLSSLNAQFIALTSSYISLSQSVTTLSQSVTNMGASVSYLYSTISTINSVILSVTSSILSITSSILSFSSSIDSISQSVSSYAVLNAFMYGTYSFSPVSSVYTVVGLTGGTVSSPTTYNISTTASFFTIATAGTYRIGVSTTMKDPTNASAGIAAATVSLYNYNGSSGYYFPNGGLTATYAQYNMGSGSNIFYETILSFTPSGTYPSRFSFSIGFSSTNYAGISLYGHLSINRII